MNRKTLLKLQELLIRHKYGDEAVDEAISEYEYNEIKSRREAEERNKQIAQLKQNPKNWRREPIPLRDNIQRFLHPAFLLTLFLVFPITVTVMGVDSKSNDIIPIFMVCYSVSYVFLLWFFRYKKVFVKPK